MEYRVSVTVESTQYQHKSYIPSQNTKNNGVLQWNIIFVWLLSRLNTQTNRILHCKTLKKWCFAMEYRICVAVESSQYPNKSYICVAVESYSIPTQIVYSVVKR